MLRAQRRDLFNEYYSTAFVCLQKARLIPMPKCVSNNVCCIIWLIRQNTTLDGPTSRIVVNKYVQFSKNRKSVKCSVLRGGMHCSKSMQHKTRFKNVQKYQFDMIKNTN